MLIISSLIFLTSYLFIYIVLKKNPIKIFIDFLLKTIKRKVIFFHFICLSVVLFLNKMELKIENKWIFIRDKAAVFYKFEKEILFAIQKTFENDLLTFVLTFFYIVVFIAMMVTSLVVYYDKKKIKTFYAFFYAIGLNYLIAIPFYLFFPINEVWYVHPQVEFLIPKIYHNFENEYRNVSGLNNCFPSLHNSISLTLLFLSLHSKIKKLKIIIGVSATLIMFSTIYLGIHWFMDMAAGAILALIASFVGVKLSGYFMEKKKLNLD